MRPSRRRGGDDAVESLQSGQETFRMTPFKKKHHYCPIYSIYPARQRTTVNHQLVVFVHRHISHTGTYTDTHTHTHTHTLQKLQKLPSTINTYNIYTYKITSFIIYLFIYCCAIPSLPPRPLQRTTVNHQLVVFPPLCTFVKAFLLRPELLGGA